MAESIKTMSEFQRYPALRACGGKEVLTQTVQAWTVIRKRYFNMLLRTSGSAFVPYPLFAVRCKAS